MAILSNQMGIFQRSCANTNLKMVKSWRRYDHFTPYSSLIECKIVELADFLHLDFNNNVATQLTLTCVHKCCIFFVHRKIIIILSIIGKKNSHVIRQAENMNLNLSRHLVRMYWNGAIERPKQNKNMKSQAFLIKINSIFCCGQWKKNHPYNQRWKEVEFVSVVKLDDHNPTYKVETSNDWCA